MKKLLLPALFIIVMFFNACQQPQSKLTYEQAKEIAEEAYIYAYPMIEHYKMMFAMAMHKESGAYNAPFNVLVNNTTLNGPKDTIIVRPNNDTFYSAVWLNLTNEPQILKVPIILNNRYYSFQIIDMYTHNIDYIGSRKTGPTAGVFMFVGPYWKGEIPQGITKVIHSEGNYLIALGRTQVFGPDDIKKAQDVMKGYKTMSLSEFTDQESDIKDVKMPDLPPFNPHKVKDAHFITYLNALMAQGPIHPDEQEIFERFAQIGIAPRQPFDPKELSPEILKAINEGIESARDKIIEASTQLGERHNGWQLINGAFGTREAMKGKYLKRAAAAYFGLWGNDMEEAFYPETTFDSNSEELDGSKHAYIIHFDANKLPPVNTFWSISMYKLPEQLFVENEINRYVISSSTKGLKYNKDGSLDIYIQKSNPGSDRSSNWLPAYDGPFSLQARLYWPKPEGLNPLYVMPKVLKHD